MQLKRKRFSKSGMEDLRSNGLSFKAKNDGKLWNLPQDVVKGKQELKINKIVSCLFSKLKFLNKLVAHTCLINKDLCF